MNITFLAQILQTLAGFIKKLVSVHQTDNHEKGIDSWIHLVMNRIPCLIMTAV